MKLNRLLILLIPLLYLGLLLLQYDRSFTEDLGRHIAIGKLILTCNCVPTTNLFSYTQPNVPWIDNSSFSQIFLYLLYSKFGQNSLLLLEVALITTSFLLIYHEAVKKSKFFWSITIAILNLSIFFTRFRMRPELFSFFLIALFLFVLNRYKEKKYFPLLFLLPILELLWVNLHIFFIFGIAIYCFFLIERLIQDRRHIDKRLFLILGIMLFTTLLNPYFISGALFPFTFLGHYAWKVKEVASPFEIMNAYGGNLTFNLSWPIILLEIESVLLIVSFFFPANRKKIFYLLISIFGILLAFNAMRLLAIFALVTLIPLAENLSDIEEKNYFNLDKSVLATIKTFIIIFLFVLVIVFYNGLANKFFGFGFYTYAENAVTFFKQVRIQGPIFNNSDIGGYLTFRLYPQEKVFIDNRPEAYTVSFSNIYAHMLSDINYFDVQADRYKINSIILSIPYVPQAFLNEIAKDKIWIPVYQDDVMLIFVRDDEKNNEIIKKYKVQLKPVSLY